MSRSGLVYMALGLVFLALISCTSAEVKEEEEKASEEQIAYAKGSMCGYCDYCKFCKLCDADCPCETSPSKPNCKMCKYCKYCYFCSSLCDTICTPGGFLDRVSSKLISSLPIHDKDTIDNDIDSMKDWIEKTKDEL